MGHWRAPRPAKTSDVRSAKRQQRALCGVRILIAHAECRKGRCKVRRACLPGAPVSPVERGRLPCCVPSQSLDQGLRSRRGNEASNESAVLIKLQRHAT